jgi:hypothetical protein
MTAELGEGVAKNPALMGRKAQMFPQLSQAQISRLKAHGTPRQMSKGEILAEPGDRNRPMLVVLSGSIEVVQPGMDGEALIVMHDAGSFTGEMSTLTGIGSLVRARVREEGEILNLDVHADPGVQTLLERFHIKPEEVPVVLFRGAVVLKNPSNEEVAACLGMNQQIDDDRVRDVIVVGAGPAGLAAADYAASEGLDVLVLNDKGFVRTGPDLTAEDIPNGGAREMPQSFETNWPGIFAFGDVRCGSVKRVAAAVGEGSACVQQVHRALHG